MMRCIRSYGGRNDKEEPSSSDDEGNNRGDSTDSGSSDNSEKDAQSSTCQKVLDGIQAILIDRYGCPLEIP